MYQQDEPSNLAIQIFVFVFFNIVAIIIGVLSYPYMYFTNSIPEKETVVNVYIVILACFLLKVFVYDFLPDKSVERRRRERLLDKEYQFGKRVENKWNPKYMPPIPIVYKSSSMIYYSMRERSSITQRYNPPTPKLEIKKPPSPVKKPLGARIVPKISTKPKVVKELPPRASKDTYTKSGRIRIKTKKFDPKTYRSPLMVFDFRAEELRAINAAAIVAEEKERKRRLIPICLVNRDTSNQTVPVPSNIQYLPTPDTVSRVSDYYEMSNTGCSNFSTPVSNSQSNFYEQSLTQDHTPLYSIGPYFNSNIETCNALANNIELPITDSFPAVKSVPATVESPSFLPKCPSMDNFASLNTSKPEPEPTPQPIMSNTGWSNFSTPVSNSQSNFYEQSLTQDHTPLYSIGPYFNSNIETCNALANNIELPITDSFPAVKSVPATVESPSFFPKCPSMDNVASLKTSKPEPELSQPTPQPIMIKIDLKKAARGAGFKRREERADAEPAMKKSRRNKAAYAA